MGQSGGDGSAAAAVLEGVEIMGAAVAPFAIREAAAEPAATAGEVEGLDLFAGVLLLLLLGLVVERFVIEEEDAFLLPELGAAAAGC